MKNNMFGEPIFQPGDTDPFATFAERFDTEVPQTLTARFLDYDEVCGWGCQLADDEGNELGVQDFADEAALRAWLKEVDVQVED